jgi:hypothetical protein
MNMAPWQDRRKTRLREYDYNSPGAYFLTICTENRKCVLSRVAGISSLSAAGEGRLFYAITDFNGIPYIL